MNQPHRPTYAEVDLRRLEANFQTLRGLLPPGTFVCPMVKANAYGHGDVEVARRLEAAGAGWLGVGLVEEGLRLRDAGIQAPLLMFGIFEDYSVSELLRNRLTPVISDWDELEILDRASSAPVTIHLKFNTGMNRLGFDLDQAAKLRSWLDTHRKFQLEGIATHLFRGEDAGVPGGDSEAQLVRFERALGPFRGLQFHAHAMNSSACVTLHARVQAKRELAKGATWPLGLRPGIALYGVQPSSREASLIDLQASLSFRSHLVMLHRLKAGEKVSYNGIWEAKRESLIGVVPVGYADGYQRQFSNNAEVLCRGRRAPVVGTVCMDYFMVDLTDVETTTGAIGPGEELVLIGEQTSSFGSDVISAEELAQRASTIPYEIFTRLSERVPRHYIR